MIMTVSTVKDKLVNVQRFVRGNLANGIDHMFIFLDGRDDEVAEWLGTQTHVTLVVADSRWWNGQRPRLLNRRQTVNANTIKAVLAATGVGDWLFHIDADEVALIDRAALAQVPANAPAVQLTPMEVVSKMHWEGDPDLFKSLLRKPELELLTTLGILSQPTNSLYFRSHIVGKAGMRPRLDLWLRVHRVMDKKRRTVPPTRDPGLRMLHYESYSGEEFVRKWGAMINSGPSIHFGDHRMMLANGMKELLSREIDPQVVERYLIQIYERHMADPVDILSDLGMITRVDPLAGQHRPTALAEHDRTRVEAMLEALRQEDKRRFLLRLGSAREVKAMLATVSARL